MSAALVTSRLTLFSSTSSNSSGARPCGKPSNSASTQPATKTGLFTYCCCLDEAPVLCWCFRSREVAMQCTRCGSTHYRKNGSSHGVQRYVCKACGCYFSARPRKFSYADKQRALDMYLNNVGIRKIARFMGASPALIVRWMKAFGAPIVAAVAAGGAVRRGGGSGCD